jgi:GGDEF domain-containing protein
MRISSFRSVDPFVATLAAALGYASVSVLADRSSGGVVELAVLGGAAVLAYVQRRFGPVRIAVGGAAAYLVVELTLGRLGLERYWEHIAAVFFLGATVIAAARTRDARDDLRQASREARDEARELRAVDELDVLLGGGKAPDQVERELLRSRRHDHSAGVLLIRPDGDDDAALRAVATELGRLLRTSDVAFRQGARDVCVLLPETEPAGARAAGERLRLALIEAGAPTVSIGAASFPDTEFKEGLLLRAGEALERARGLGGNRTVASFLPPTAPPAWRLDGAVPSLEQVTSPQPEV